MSGGRLTVRWTIAASGDCIIDWCESGGPIVAKPERTGFGTKLIQSTISHDLGGSAEIDYAPEGLRGTFAIPARHLKAVEDSGIVAEAIGSPLQDLQGMKVMLVEDQALIAMDTEDVLRLLGALNIRLIATTADALAALAADTPDCVVPDFNLGEVTAEAIADRLVEKGIPFVFATGYGDTVMIPERFLAIPIVRKPISGPALAEQIGKVVPTRVG